MPDLNPDALVTAYSRLTVGSDDRSLPPRLEKPDLFKHVQRPHHISRDITAEFAQACQSLEQGQVVKDESFTLYESVQALEIMDPKMDSGYLEEGETLDDNFDAAGGLSPHKLIGIIDQLLCYEAAWHQGYPLSQTLFISLHINDLLTQDRSPNIIPTFRSRDHTLDNPVDIELVNTVLHAYCVGMIKTCDIVLEMVAAQHYYEEEDFTTQTYQRDLLTDVPDEQCAALLDRACEWLRDRRKGWAHGVLSSNTSDELAFQDRHIDALTVRLEARKSFVLSFIQDQSDEAVPPVQRWYTQKARYGAIAKSHDLAIPVEEAFSSKMHRKLASTAPPRPSIELTFELSIDMLTRMCDDLIEATSFGNYEHNASPESIRSYLWTYSSRKPTPSTFARAALQALVLGEGRPAGTGGIESLILEELRENVVPMDFILDGSFWEVEMPTDPRYEVARKFDWFFERAAQPFSNIFRALCQNRCRIRRFLVNLLPELDDLVQEMTAAFQTLPGHSTTPSNKRNGLYYPLLAPTKIDGHIALAENALLAMTRLQTLKAMQWIIQLGFEHNIYKPHELSSMYKVLSSICGTSADILQSTTTVLLAYQQTPSFSRSQEKFARQKLKLLELRRMRLSAQAAFSQGLAQLYTFLEQQDLLSTPLYPYSTPSLRYQLRMRPFLQLSHPPLPIPPESSEGPHELEGTRLLSVVDGNLGETVKLVQTLLKEHACHKALGIEGVEHAWVADAKATLRAAVSARLNLKRLRDWHSRANEAVPEKHHLDVKIPDGDADDFAEGWWLIWIVPEVSADKDQG